ncbi:MAG: hypothetical protein ACRD0J_01855 [Acidimicrobiales bacterium]
MPARAGRLAGGGHPAWVARSAASYVYKARWYRDALRPYDPARDARRWG